jgi:transposase
MIRNLAFAAALALPLSAHAQENQDWKVIFEVISHPRCANCHTDDQHPRWFDKATKQHKFHGMNVQRGVDGRGNAGLRCTNRHQASNSGAQNGPPGAPNWHLAPPEMVWFGKSSTDVCAQFKDPSRTAGRDLPAMADHVRKDSLVAWGWTPGGDREAAPHSAQALYEAILRWQRAGAPCQ